VSGRDPKVLVSVLLVSVGYFVNLLHFYLFRWWYSFLFFVCCLTGLILQK